MSRAVPVTVGEHRLPSRHVLRGLQIFGAVLGIGGAVLSYWAYEADKTAFLHFYLVVLYTDAYSLFGALSAEMMRAVRLVVDTGIHAKGWSREKAIDYFRANTALGEADITAEVERYIAWPGQALAFKVGQLKILELRRRAQASLGPRVDVRAFHGQVVDSGSLPLAVLEKKVDRWIAAQQ